jgi:parallel beta-helix repeat protein
VHVEADGSGDYATLEEGIQNVPEGAVLLLGPGTYHLDRLLTVDGMPFIARPLHLAGAGMDETEIVYSGTSYILRFEGEGPFVVEDITFRYEGGDNGYAVVVTGGEARFNRCRFAGTSEVDTTGVLFSEDATGIVGLLFSGNATGRVQSSEAVGNYYGIQVTGEAQVVIEDSTFTRNQSGIVYADNASGTVRGNTCHDNYAGIAITPDAEPTVEGNVCTNNQVGITYVGTEETIEEGAGGIARSNTCRENQAGIAVTYAHPHLEGNICSDNSLIGISLSEGAGGTAVDNECARNGRTGILIVEGVDPDLELGDNRCYDNGEVDIDDQR